MSCRLEGTGILVNPENDDAVAVLVGDEAKFAGWVDVEVSRDVNIGCFVLDES